MPTWCTFRDAARKEHMAREIASASIEIAAIAPQATQFQTARLRSLASTMTPTASHADCATAMARRVTWCRRDLCCTATSATAQPVGGLVIAYEKQISNIRCVASYHRVVATWR